MRRASCWRTRSSACSTTARTCAGSNSASVAGTVLDELYADREPIADLIVAADAAVSPAAFAATVRAELVRRALTDRRRRISRAVRRRGTACS